MNTALVVAAGATAFAGYTYVGYPALLWVIAKRRTSLQPEPHAWPRISIVLPAFNEEQAIRGALEAILAADYPPSQRQVIVVSDASSDGTDALVGEYQRHGVQLLRRPQRGGKTAAENAAAQVLTGEIVISTDASVRVHPGAFKELVRALADPAVGVASARDVSVGDKSSESSYVGYEMWVRALETAVGGIVGASGCLYAIRAPIHRLPVPPDLSRDFASALTAREMGYRAVSVPSALCLVPHTPSLREEYRRKVRTVARGLNTLFHKRRLLNPLRFGSFAWMLASHKLCRWLLPWMGLAALAAIAALATQYAWARVVAAGAAAGLGGGLLGWAWPGERVPRLLRVLGFGLAGNVAVLHAWLRAMAGRKTPLWSPTRRPVSPAPSGPQHYRERQHHDLEVFKG